MLKVAQFGPVTRFDLSRRILGRGRYWTTAYLVDGLMIDTGCAHTSEELVEALDGKRIDVIINTHSHEDHIGANAEIGAGRSELQIRAHRAALPLLQRPQALDLQLYRRVFWGLPYPSNAREIGHGEHLRTADYSYEVLHTPGHCPDHLCLYERDQGWLFSGDLFVGGEERALRRNADIWGIIASLKKVASLPVRTLFPGCSRVREHPIGALRRKIDYLEGCGQEVINRYQKGWSERAIARHLFGRPTAVELITCRDFSRRHLVDSYLRHPEIKGAGRVEGE